MSTRSSIEFLEPRRLYSTAQLAADIKVGPIGSDPQQITGTFVPGIGPTAVFTWNGWLQRLNGTNVEYVGPAYPRPNGVQYLGRAAGYLYFSSTPNDAFAAPTLWRSDGTDAGTARVTSTDGTFEYAYPKQFMTAGSSVYFTTSGPNSRTALWETAPNGSRDCSKSPRANRRT